MLAAAAEGRPSSSDTCARRQLFPRPSQRSRIAIRHPRVPSRARRQAAPGSVSLPQASAPDILSASWIALRRVINLKRQLAEFNSVLVKMNAVQILGRRKDQSSLAASLRQAPRDVQSERRIFQVFEARLIKQINVILSALADESRFGMNLPWVEVFTRRRIENVPS